MKTGISLPAAYPVVWTIVCVFGYSAFSAVTTASDSVVQCAASAGVPPAKWYRFDHVLVFPRYVNDFVTFRDGVAAIRRPYQRPSTDEGAPEAIGA